MVQARDNSKPEDTGKSRKDRLKKALKANMAKRKAQVRARTGVAGNKS